MDTTTQLSGVIQTSVEERSVEKLNTFLLSTPDTSEVLNSKTLVYFYKLIKKDAKHEVKCLHVSCVLSCLQHFLDSDIDISIWEHLADKVSILCGLLFLISATLINNNSLVDRSINIAMHMIQSSQILADSMLRKMLELLLQTVSAVMYSNNSQLLTLVLISSLLQKSTRETRRKTLPSVSIYMTKLSNNLLVCGDYETQVSMVEILARCWTFIKEDCPGALFTNCPSILQHFNSYTFLNFDPECRLFLNQVNSSLEDRQLVYSVPGLVVIADGVSLKKPLDPLYKEFWLDFNTSTRSISFYYMVSGEENWEVMNIEEKHVLYVMARNSFCKSKEGEVIPAVKMEITMKVDPTKPNLPKAFKIYPRKTCEFANAEKNFISKIFKEKYKSEVSYSDLRLEGTGTRLPIPHPKFDETAVTIPDTSVAANPVVDQLPEKSDSEESDLIGPSPAFELRASEKKSVVETKTSHQLDVSDSSQDSRGFDTFADYVKGLKTPTDVVNDDISDGNNMLGQSVTVESCKSKEEDLNKTGNSCMKKECKNYNSGSKEEFFGIVTPKK
uniref:Synaptonemal complex protein 2 Spt16M-like domain-containing protein n=1 Tax=Graphocephala atropunctata TaxID=36148 RepID=A0A1B6LFF5_9HEMI